jgi:hypothetical protein
MNNVGALVQLIGTVTADIKKNSVDSFKISENKE